MNDERKTAGTCPWIVALIIGLPMLYIASFWPACWLIGNGLGNERVAGSVYYPLLIATNRAAAMGLTLFPAGGNAKEGVVLMNLSVGLIKFDTRF